MKLLKIDLDLIKIIQFWTFLDILLKPPQPFAGLIYDLFYRVWSYDLLLELQDDRNKGSQPYVLIIITHNPKYLNQFCMVLHETLTTGLVFARRSKQGVTTLCFDYNYT